jgi:alpha-D-ribose 1-methylphosphonate 5-triphosphate synthase subunit PhnH
MRRRTAWLIGHVGLPVVLLTTTSFAWQLLLMQTMSTENELFQFHVGIRAKPPRGTASIVPVPSESVVDVAEQAYAGMVGPVQDIDWNPVIDASYNGATAAEGADSPPWK